MRIGNPRLRKRMREWRLTMGGIESPDACLHRVRTALAKSEPPAYDLSAYEKANIRSTVYDELRKGKVPQTRWPSLPDWMYH